MIFRVVEANMLVLLNKTDLSTAIEEEDQTYTDSIIKTSMLDGDLDPSRKLYLYGIFWPTGAEKFSNDYKQPSQKLLSGLKGI